jgi:diguanylate cyclase (GGDEF)-like protein
MIDIDYFKLFNDSFAGVAGDACLRKVGRILEVGGRPSDLLARYGGEEMAVTGATPTSPVQRSSRN